MVKKILVCIMLITGFSGPGFAQDRDDVNVEFEGIYWFTEMRAKAQINGQTERGTEFNLERDLDIRDKDIPGGRFTWFTGPKSRLFLEYGRVDYESQATLSRTIVVRDRTFDAGASVLADLKVGFAKLGWIWQFIDSGNGTFKLGTLLEARGIFTEFALSGKTSGGGSTQVEERISLGLPTLGFAMDINPLKWANLFFRTSGMYFGQYGYIADGEAGIKLIPARNLSLSGGYRYQATEPRDKDTDSRLRLIFQGPFAAVSLRF